MKCVLGGTYEEVWYGKVWCGVAWAYFVLIDVLVLVGADGRGIGWADYCLG